MGNFSNQVQDVKSDYTWTRTTYVASSGVLTTTSGRKTSSELTNVRFASRSGGKTPNYRAIVKAGGTLPDQPLAYEKYVSPNANWAILESFTRNSTGWSRERRVMLKTNLYIPGIPLNPFSDSELGLRLIKKAKGAEWSLPVFLGELGETAGMVAKVAGQLTSMVLALRKGDIRRFFRLFHPSVKRPRERAIRRAKRKFDQNFGRDPVKTVSDAWLEYQYGWKPFCKEVHDAFALLSDLQDKSDFNVASVRTTLKKNYIAVLDGGTRLTSFADILIGGKAFTTWDLSGSAVWRFKIKELNTLGKLGLTNPLSAAWNLASLSFVVDWFVPIGDYLDALDVPMRFQHVGGSWGYRASGETEYVGLRPQGGWTLLGQSLNSTQRVYVQRRPMTGLPTPRLADLSFRANLGIQQAISAQALFLQTVRNVIRK